MSLPPASDAFAFAFAIPHSLFPIPALKYFRQRPMTFATAAFPIRARRRNHA